MERTFKIIEENFTTNYKKLSHFHLELDVKRKFLWFYFTKTYQVRNIILHTTVGLETEEIIDRKIIFFSKKAIELFLSENRQNINDNGIYIGSLSTVKLNEIYNNYEQS